MVVLHSYIDSATFRERGNAVKSGFVPIRRGIEEHLRSGCLSFFELGVYLTIHLQTDYRSGVWLGSAARLQNTAPRGASLREVQRALNRLQKIGFIRVFHRHGVRGNYRVLIDKYEPTTGALMGKRLNAAKSESWQYPHYVLCAVGDAVSDALAEAETGSVAAPYQEERGEGKTIPSDSPATSKAKSSSAVLGLLRQVVERIPNAHRHDAHSFHSAVHLGLKNLGWEVIREWHIADCGNGRPGFIDLVVTQPQPIAIEIDRINARQNSIAKLSRFDGLRAVVLREKRGHEAVLDLTHQSVGAHDIERRTNGASERNSDKSWRTGRAGKRLERNAQAVRQGLGMQ